MSHRCLFNKLVVFLWGREGLSPILKSISKMILTDGGLNHAVKHFAMRRNVGNLKQ